MADLQRSSYASAKESLKAGQVIMVIDFKENLKLGSAPVEVGQDFYEKTSVSCLGCAVHVGKNDGACVTHYYDILSYCLSHDGLYVQKAVDLVIPRVRELAGGSESAISDLSIWLDCGPHFRNYEVLHDFMITLPQTWSIPTVRLNFFAEHHGKSIVDGHFGHVSRAVKQKSMQQRLVNIDDLVAAIKEYFTKNTVSAYVMDTPQRSIVQRLKLKQGSKNVKISQVYCFVSKSSGVDVSFSVLSSETPNSCSLETSMEVDTRSTKMPPKLDERTAPRQPTVGPMVGPMINKKLTSHFDHLTGNGTLS